MKKTLVIPLFGVLLLGSVGLLLAHQATSPSQADGLKGQQNTTLTFYGLVVDQDGRPLDGAHIEYRLEAYPKDWTFETRGRDNEVQKITFTSDENGRFRREITGCKMIRLSASRPGYRHFAEEALNERGGPTDTFGYQLAAQDDIWYKSDPDHPAIYVFVKDGMNEVSALPSHGGYGPGRGQMRLYEPGWPKKPSLKDAVQKQPTTLPTSQP